MQRRGNHCDICTFQGITIPVKGRSAKLHNQEQAAAVNKAEAGGGKLKINSGNKTETSVFKADPVITCG